MAGCGGGGSTPQGISTSFSGVVADGYLVGAKVCSDQNLNKVCDAGEPTATTIKGGAYTLTGTDVQLYPILVVVSAGVIDEDAPNTPIVNPYVMSAPKPADITTPQVVSPITTLVQNQLETDTSLTRTGAAAAVRTQLGVTDSVDVFADFVAEAKTNITPATKIEYELIHATARVVASAMADAKTVIETAAGEQGVNVATLTADITKLVMANVQKQLQEIVSTIAAAQTVAADAVANGNTAAAFDPAAFDTTTVSITAPDTTSVAQDIAAVAVVPQAGKFETALKDGGFHWLWARVNNYGNGIQVGAEYGIVTADANNVLAETQMDWDNTTMAFVPRINSDNYYLVNKQWVKGSDSAANQTIAFATDSATITSATFNLSSKITMTQKDIAGLPMKPFAGSDVGKLLLDDSAVFPAGSIFYTTTFTNLQDEYRVDIWEDNIDPTIDTNQVRDWSNGGQIVTSLANVISTFADNTNGPYLYVENLQVQFAANGVLNIFSNNNTQNTPVKLGTGNYMEKIVQGQTLLMLNIPPTLKKERAEESSFLVEQSDPSLGSIVKTGSFTPANSVSTDTDFSGNQLAFNALKANLNTTGVLSGGFFTGNFIQHRNMEDGTTSSKAMLSLLSTDPIGTRVAKVDLYAPDGTTLVGTSTTPTTQNYYQYDCRSGVCSDNGILTDVYYWFSLAPATTLSPGTYQFDTTLSAGSTLLTTSVSFPGEFDLPIITSSTISAAWNQAGDLTLSWPLPSTGTNWDKVTTIRAILKTTNLDIFVQLPSTATGAVVPASVLAPLGITEANAANIGLQLQTRSHDAAKKNYGRGISNTISLQTAASNTGGGGSSTPAPTTGFTASMLDASPTYYVTYAGNDTTNVGTTQETWTISGTGPYSVAVVSRYYVSNVLQTTNNIAGTFTLNQDGTVTGTQAIDPTNPATFTMTNSTTSYLDVAGIDNGGPWSDLWYFAPPAGWLTAGGGTTPAPTMGFTASMLDASPTYYVTYAGNDTTNVGTTQETLTISGTGPYSVAVVSRYYVSNVLQTTNNIAGTFTLNQDGTVTGTQAIDPTNPATFTMTNSTTSYLDVAGIDNGGPWSELWYFAPPTGWL